jgi:hypothetical protein
VLLALKSRRRNARRCRQRDLARDGGVDAGSAPLSILGLGGSVPTPAGGVTARVVVVHSFDELEARAAEVKGALVLFDVPLTAWTDTPSNYGAVAAYRVGGPSRAARLGAVGVLMRSVTACFWLATIAARYSESTVWASGLNCFR